MVERARFKVLELFSEVTLSAVLPFAVIVVAAHNEDMTSFCEAKTRRHSRIGDDVEADARGGERRNHSGDGGEDDLHTSEQVLNSL